MIKSIKNNSKYYKINFLIKNLMKTNNDLKWKPPIKIFF